MIDDIRESPLFLGLNDKQKEAVLISPNDNVLCLSGAGTGKTKTLVAKIAILIKGFEIKEKEILAVTFTNKAAHEMQERMNNVFGKNLNDLLIGTFHSIAYKLIKQEPDFFPDYPTGFSIMDEQDRNSLIKRLFKDDDEQNNKEKSSTKEKNERLKEFVHFLNYYREAGISYNDLINKRSKISSKKEKWLPYYKMYEKRLILEKQIDFSGLLILLRNALKNEPEFFEKYSGAYKCILVDEFQDTNNIQFEIVKLLTKKGGSIFAVGDDDQSIYGFRGANVENIRNFAKNDAKYVIKLEQNYRSSKNILSVANNIISDVSTTNKKLWTDNDDGCLVRVYKYKNEKDEAFQIANDIKTKINDGILPEDIAILYRVNSQSAVLEEQLLKNQIDYKIVGGLKFFERKEIKDVLAHAKLLVSLDDINAFTRAISNPSSFGIGDKRLSIWKKMAINNNISFDIVIREVAACDNIAYKFLNTIKKAREEINTLGVYEGFKNYLDTIQFWDMYKDDEKRITRINELLELLRIYDESGGKNFSDFINFLIINESNKTNQNEYCIHLSSVHAAKGLEFEYVYLISLNEGIFPHLKSLESPKELEEEKRLMYVGITRAKTELNLSFYEKKSVRNKKDILIDVISLIPSRYLSDINPKYIENRLTNWPPTPKPKDWGKYNNNKTGIEISNEIANKERNIILKNKTTNIVNKNNIVETEFMVGEYIKHERYGIGKILAINSGIDHITDKIEIEFNDRKRILFLNYIKLEKIDVGAYNGTKQKK